MIRCGRLLRPKGTLANTILHGEVEGEISIGRPERQSLDIEKEWRGLSFEGDVEGVRGPCGMEKACQSRCPQRTE